MELNIAASKVDAHFEEPSCRRFGELVSAFLSSYFFVLGRDVGRPSVSGDKLLSLLSPLSHIGCSSCQKVCSGFRWRCKLRKGPWAVQFVSFCSPSFW